MNEQLAINRIADDLGLPANSGERFNLLVAHINELLERDFATLLNLLYRVDVNEEKLKSLLRSNPETDAALLIARLLIERQIEKLKSKEPSKNSDDIPEDEKW
jgi:hypothetical protein